MSFLKCTLHLFLCRICLRRNHLVYMRKMKVNWHGCKAIKIKGYQSVSFIDRIPTIHHFIKLPSE
jgi:hypothetical protein